MFINGVSASASLNIEPIFLCERVDVKMTDAVKNTLKSKKKNSNALGSSYQTYHLVCKSHAVDALHKSNLKVLAKIKKSVKQQEVLEHINPILKSYFLRKEVLLLETVIKAFLLLITLNCW